MSIGGLGQTVRYPNPEKRGIQPHIYGRNCLLKGGACALLIYLDAPFIGVMLGVIWLSSSVLYVILLHDLYK